MVNKVSWQWLSRTSQPGRQESVVAACQESVTLRSHPASVKELVRELLLHCLAVIGIGNPWGEEKLFSHFPLNEFLAIDVAGQ